jgi:hypothetical protein
MQFYAYCIRRNLVHVGTGSHLGALNQELILGLHIWWVLFLSL